MVIYQDEDLIYSDMDKNNIRIDFMDEVTKDIGMYAVVPKQNFKKLLVMEYDKNHVIFEICKKYFGGE